MKYPNRGLIGTDGTLSTLLSKLYATCVAFMTTPIFLSSLVKKIKDYDHHNRQEKFLIDVIVKKNIHVNFDFIALTHFLLTFVLGLIQFFSVRYIMRENKFLRTRKYQNNIITFHGNFFSFFLFEFFEITSKVFIFSQIKITTPTPNVYVYYQLIRAFVFGFIRPIIILLFLKRNMPEFFTDCSQELRDENNRFYIIGNVSPAPRQQNFSQYKTFSQNARWGWQRKRFMQANEEISLDCRVGGKALGSNLMPNVEI